MMRFLILTIAWAALYTWLLVAGRAIAPVVGRLDAIVVGRLLIAVVLCGAIGLERSTHERASGFRTHILVGLGACLMTLAGGYGFSDLKNGIGDPMRVASYVVSGIGFLGAGAILRHGTTVRGLTTAASLLGHPLRPEQVAPLVQRLLALECVSRVDTKDLNLSEEAEAPDADAVGMVEYDTPEEETGERQ